MENKKRTGLIYKVSGNMVSVAVDGEVIQNEVAFILHGKKD